MISQGASEINLTFVIEEDDAAEVVRRSAQRILRRSGSGSVRVAIFTAETLSTRRKLNGIACLRLLGVLASRRLKVSHESADSRPRQNRIAGGRSRARAPASRASLTRRRTPAAAPSRRIARDDRRRHRLHHAAAAVANVEACIRAKKNMVVGTTGWYDQIAALARTGSRAKTGFVYGVEFLHRRESLLRNRSHRRRRAQVRLLRPDLRTPSRAQERRALRHRDHASRRSCAKPAADGSLRSSSFREGDAVGMHELVFNSAADRIYLCHDAKSRQRIRRRRGPRRRVACGQNRLLRFPQYLARALVTHPASSPRHFSSCPSLRAQMQPLARSVILNPCNSEDVVPLSSLRSLRMALSTKLLCAIWSRGRSNRASIFWFPAAPRAKRPRSLTTSGCTSST